jgi:hypothetical protein
MQMRGFFVSRLCRKLAFVNRRGAKKPNEHVVFVWKALGKVPTEEVGEVKRSRQSRIRQCEALAVPFALTEEDGEVKRSRQSRGFWEDVLNEVKNGSPVFLNRGSRRSETQPTVHGSFTKVI